MKWHERALQKMKELGWTGAELSRRAEIEIKTVYKYLDGKVENPRGNTFKRIAEALGCSEQWLRYGQLENMNTHDVILNNNPDNLQIPIVDGKMLSLFIEGSIEYSNIILSSNLMPFITKSEYSSELFAVIIDDETNSPDLNPGDIIVIDINQKPSHGKYACALIGGKTLVATYTLTTKDRPLWIPFIFLIAKFLIYTYQI